MNRCSLLLLLALLLAGCGNSRDFVSTPQAAPQASGAQPARIQGFLVQVNPVLMVDRLENAPLGSRPLNNAMVLARDCSGAAVGMSLTDASGRFVLDQLPGGLVNLEGWSDPAGAGPDVEMSMTSVSGFTLQANQRFAIDRNRAIDLARPLFEADDLVACSLNPLPTQTLIEVLEVTRRLESPQWLMLLNRQPDSFFTHPSVLVLVDAQTGNVESLEVESYPNVNGLPLWGKQSDLIFIPEFLIVGIVILDEHVDQCAGNPGQDRAEHDG